MLKKCEKLRRERIKANAKINPNYGMKGKKHNKSTRKKMSDAWHYKRHFNKRIKRKISLSLKGKMPKNIELLKKVNIGKKFTEEHKKKLSKAQKKRFKENPISEEEKIRMSLRMLKNPVKYWLGRGEERKGKMPHGKHHFNWKGGISFEPYAPTFNKILKQKIKIRDNFTCQLCNNKINLVVHHIDYNKKNNKEHNLITLCAICNGIVNFSREDWKIILNEKIRTKQRKEEK